VTSLLIEAVLLPKLEVVWLLFGLTPTSLYQKDESVRMCTWYFPHTQHVHSCRSAV